LEFDYKKRNKRSLSPHRIKMAAGDPREVFATSRTSTEARGVKTPESAVETEPVVEPGVSKVRMVREDAYGVLDNLAVDPEVIGGKREARGAHYLCRRPRPRKATRGQGVNDGRERDTRPWQGRQQPLPRPRKVHRGQGVNAGSERSTRPLQERQQSLAQRNPKRPRPRKAKRGQGVNDERERDTLLGRGGNSLCPDPERLPEAKGSMPEARGAHDLC
jgi:hypothetical protein